jgi:hypothetical protein
MIWELANARRAQISCYRGEHYLSVRENNRKKKYFNTTKIVHYRPIPLKSRHGAKELFSVVQTI